MAQGHDYSSEMRTPRLRMATLMVFCNVPGLEQASTQSGIASENQIVRNAETRATKIPSPFRVLCFTSIKATTLQPSETLSHTIQSRVDNEDVLSEMPNQPKTQQENGRRGTYPPWSSFLSNIVDISHYISSSLSTYSAHQQVMDCITA